MITLGDKVLYWPYPSVFEPFIGMVVKVWDHNDVNIVYWNTGGTQLSAQHVKVINTAIHVPEYGYCEIPPLEVKKVGRSRKVAT